MNNKIPEILAPVGNSEMLLAAVRSGADAVYLGMDDFNARRGAENFNSSTIKDAVGFCHTRGVKVYLTLNTVVSDGEMFSALSVAKLAAKCGIDAVIVADLGLASLIKKNFKDLPIHASTQLSVHSAAALPYLKNAGFSRVVVSREMDRASLANFCQKAKEFGIEVEVFVHGALCMSVSGQCLLSAVIGGRSGNRGLCAGPCRLPFNNGSNQYALSLKDLSLIDYTQELSKMGVASFKIEGRMKRPEYVAAAVAAFKNAVNGQNDNELKELLNNVFSRSGFTAGYYLNKTGYEMFGIRTTQDVKASGSVLSKIHSLYRAENQSVPITACFRAALGREITLTLTDGINRVEAKGSAPEKAINKATNKEDVFKNLNKLGSTPYYLQEHDILIDKNLFIPAALINDLRRAACEQLNALRSAIKNEQYNVEVPNLAVKKQPDKQQIYCRFQNTGVIPEDLNGIDLIALPLEADITDFKVPTGVKTAVELPRGIENEDFILRRLALFKENGFEYAFCGTLAAKELATLAGYKTIADIGFNVFNSHTAAALEQNGASQTVLSPELTATQISNIKTNLPTGFFAYGRLPLMLTKNCPVKTKNGCGGCKKDRTVTDRLGKKFPVACQNGFSVLYNSVPIWLADKKSDFAKCDFMYLYFTFETAQTVKKVITAYQNGDTAKTEYSRGLYFRGVK